MGMYVISKEQGLLDFFFFFCRKLGICGDISIAKNDSVVLLSVSVSSSQCVTSNEKQTHICNLKFLSNFFFLLMQIHPVEIVLSLLAQRNKVAQCAHLLIDWF